ncbi:uncharacterized protein LOC106050795 isoform X2 [Biomphalaria glabrata]|uniref:Uncharacterized protein LOC106050795 isoform X2 n=1 Tax=Biomphalaria glabrata TaxID=6526 RepID=A0A9W2Z7Z2_BIOGL|nr:uncharacterized protein LOC106050795 isoform X2 [Biomphalaria glabrata]
MLRTQKTHFFAYRLVSFLISSNLIGCILTEDKEARCSPCDSNACIDECRNCCPDGFFFDVTSCNVTSTLTTTNWTLSSLSSHNSTSATTITTTATPSTTLSTIQHSTQTDNTTTTSNTTHNSTSLPASHTSSVPTVPSTPQIPDYCRKCEDPNCAKCTNTICEHCLKGYVLNETNGSCYPNVPDTSSTNNAAIIGGAVGGAVGGLLLVGLLVLGVLYYRKRTQRRQRMNDVNLDQTDTEDQNPRPKNPHLERQKSIELAEDIQRTHDKVLRYTRDPTTKRKNSSNYEETDELEDLGEAPLPPQQNNDRKGGKAHTSHSKFKQDAHDNAHENVYANSATLRQDMDDSDGMYVNNKTVKAEVARAFGAQKQSTLTDDFSPESNDLEDEQEIYANDDSELVKPSNENEGHELYLNDALEEDEIYLNVKK